MSKETRKATKAPAKKVNKCYTVAGLEATKNKIDLMVNVLLTSGKLKEVTNSVTGEIFYKILVDDMFYYLPASDFDNAIYDKNYYDNMREFYTTAFESSYNNLPVTYYLLDKFLHILFSEHGIVRMYYNTYSKVISYVEGAGHNVVTLRIEDIEADYMIDNLIFAIYETLI